MKYLAVLCWCGVAVFSMLPACTEGEARAEEPPKVERAKENPVGAKIASEKAANVRVQALEPSKLVEYVIANGITEANRKVTYSAEIPGRIEYLRGDVGDRVRKGKLLVRIDYQTLKAQATQAEAAYELAQATYKRLFALRGDDLVSQQQIDEARSQLVSTEAAYAIARANLAKSEVETSYSGVINDRFVEKGEYVGPGSRLFDVVDYRKIIVEAPVAETQVNKLKPGSEVEVRIGALGKTFTGKVDTVIPTANPTSNTFNLRVEIDNPELEILIGMSATVRVVAEIHDNVVAVKQSSVIEEANEKHVFIVDNGIARKRPVELGATQNDLVVLAGGVLPGEQLVVLGQRELSDGQPVNIVR